MYENFRTELTAKLAHLDVDTLKQVLVAVDQVAQGYKIEKASTQVIVYDAGVPEVVKAYLVSRAIEGLSERTLKLYRSTLVKFFCEIGKSFNTLTTNDLRVWLFNYEQNNSVSKRTMELYRQIIGGFYHWAKIEGMIDINPCDAVKPIKYSRKPRKAMAQLELEYIRNACETPKELAVVELLYSTGCRVSEVKTIQISTIDWERKEVLVLGKGGKYRTVYLNAKAIVALKKYLKTRNDDSDALIAADKKPHNAIGKNGIERIVKRVVTRVNQTLSVPVTPHVFRHTTATTALQRGMPVQDVQRMLGHSSINTTMIYAEVNQAEVKNAHIKCVV